MTPQPELATDALSVAGAAESAAPAAGASPFVLNLCSSTTPMALAQTELPELRRFTFFVSRRFEEGRERFRLHMGYFATLAEAEEWLNVVREIYPGAWAGEAPGRKLRERAAAAAAAQAQHAAGPQPRLAVPAPRPPAPLPTTRVAAPAARTRSVPPPQNIPVLQAAPTPARPPTPMIPAIARQRVTPSSAPRSAPLDGVPRPAPSAPAPARTAAAAASAAAAAAPRAVRPALPPRVAAPARPATPPRPAMPPRAAAPVRPPAAAPPAALPAASVRARAAAAASGKPVFEDSNVREVLAALGETSATGETRLMHAPAPPRGAPAAQDGHLTDTQVLRVLENRRPEDGEKSTEKPAEMPASSIPLLKPDDTGTRAALKEAVVNNAPVSFAVQLHWSVQPVELDKVPPLAIFSAYTLYTVEGSREGRRWYGLRLGFFNDAISAKQVAYYVRSEFGTVAVVPVSPQERARASDEERHASGFSAPAATRRAANEEFKLIDIDMDARPPPALARPQPPPRAAAKPAARPAGSAAAVARGRGRGSGKVGARERKGPQTLEETLEILGASQLAIDDGAGEVVNDTGVRHLRVEVAKNSPFSRLLERLSERMKKD